MTISLISETKFIDQHNELLYKLRQSGFATKNFGPFTKEHKMIFVPPVNQHYIKIIKSDLYNFLLSLNIGYLPKLWKKGYETLGNFGIVISEDPEVDTLIMKATFDNINNVICFNPKLMTFDELKEKIQLHFNKIILEKSICK